MIGVQTVSAQAYQARDKPAPSHHSGLPCHLFVTFALTPGHATAAACLLLAWYKPCTTAKVIQSCTTPAIAGRAELPQLHSSLAVICHPCTQPLELALTDLILLNAGGAKHGKTHALMGKLRAFSRFWVKDLPQRHLG